MKEQDYYKNKIIEIINDCDSLSILEWLYKFLVDGMKHWK